MEKESTTQHHYQDLWMNGLRSLVHPIWFCFTLNIFEDGGVLQIYAFTFFFFFRFCFFCAFLLYCFYFGTSDLLLSGGVTEPVAFSLAGAHGAGLNRAALAVRKRGYCAVRRRCGAASSIKSGISQSWRQRQSVIFHQLYYHEAHNTQAKTEKTNTWFRTHKTVWRNDTKKKQRKNFQFLARKIGEFSHYRHTARHIYKQNICTI